MEDVQAWIQEQGAYQVGLQLYFQHPNHNRNIAQLLSLRENLRNRAKLEYELKKVYRQRPLKTELPVKPKATVVRSAGKAPEKELQEVSTQKFQGNIRLHDLHPSLHQKFIKQKDVYYKIWQMHYRLEDIEDDQKRLDVLRQVMAGWDYINAVWREIDYWMAHRQLADDSGILELEQLSPEKLAARKLSIRSNISRYQKKVLELKQAHEKTMDLKQKNKLFNQLSKAKSTLERNELRMARINQLTNE